MYSLPIKGEEGVFAYQREGGGVRTDVYIKGKEGVVCTHVPIKEEEGVCLY